MKTIRTQKSHTRNDGLNAQGKKLETLINHKNNGFCPPQESVQLAQDLHTAIELITKSLVTGSRKPRLDRIRKKFAELGISLLKIFQYTDRRKISLPAIIAPDFIDSLLTINSESSEKSKTINAQTLVRQIQKLAPTEILEEIRQQHIFLTYTLYQAGINRQEAEKASGIPTSTVHRHYKAFANNEIPPALQEVRAYLFIAQNYKKNKIYTNRYHLAQDIKKLFGVSQASVYRVVDKYKQHKVNLRPTASQKALIALINSAPRQGTEKVI